MFSEPRVIYRQSSLYKSVNSVSDKNTQPAFRGSDTNSAAPSLTPQTQSRLDGVWATASASITWDPIVFPASSGGVL